MLQIREWRSKVYRAGEHDERHDTPEWRRTRRAVLYRDNYHCLRCDKRFPSDRLTVHHLIPRSEGGPDIMTNLVTLCGECHDLVEIQNLRTYAAIVGSMESPPTEFPPEHPEPEGEDPYHRPEWHPYVYGGKRRRNR